MELQLRRVPGLQVWLRGNNLVQGRYATPEGQHYLSLFSEHDISNGVADIPRALEIRRILAAADIPFAVVGSRTRIYLNPNDALPSAKQRGVESQLELYRIPEPDDRDVLNLGTRNVLAIALGNVTRKVASFEGMPIDFAALDVSVTGARSRGLLQISPDPFDVDRMKLRTREIDPSPWSTSHRVELAWQGPSLMVTAGPWINAH